MANSLLVLPEEKDFWHFFASSSEEKDFSSEHFCVEIFSIFMREASLTSFVRPSEAPRSMAQQNWESHDMGCKFLCALTTVFVFRSLFYACIHECMHKYFVAITCRLYCKF